MGKILADTGGHEQSKGITDVDQSISAIDETTQRNFTLVEEVGAAAASLFENADHVAFLLSDIRDPKMPSILSCPNLHLSVVKAQLRLSR